MSFNGSAGGGLIGDTNGGQPGTLLPAGAYSSFPVSGVNTAGHWILTDDQGPRRLHAIYVSGLSLGPWDGSATMVDPSKVYVGALVSAVAAANQHGLPVNFGPGRGNWTTYDLPRLLIIMCDDGTTGYLNGPYQNPISAICDNVAISGSDVVISVYNKGKASATALHINLVWLHSVGQADHNT